ncbi:hypothetical protein GCM10022268_00670 [Sphingomonas cynarae]|uniref:UvrD-like helicase C-terminal domain-containing protein n=1 Tax=Sphingomonas cynarae TaxID=930197 RepID=A0ABP7CS10_9SPHN
MDTTTDITRLPEWAIYAYADVWPRVPGHAFIVDAAARAIWAKFGISAIDVGTDPDTHGYRSEVAQRLAEFLTDGNLIAYARPAGGTRLAPSRPPSGIWTRHGRRSPPDASVVVGEAIVDARAVYVAISRARKLATLYTDSRADFTEALGIRDGAQVGAIDETMKAPEVATATPATVKAVGMAIGG